jgi:hypothetical protein
VWKQAIQCSALRIVLINHLVNPVFGERVEHHQHQATKTLSQVGL